MKRRVFARSTAMVAGSTILAGCAGADDEEADGTVDDGEADIEFVEESYIEDDGDSYAEIIAENVGEADSGTVELTVEWMDGTGSFLGDDPFRCWTIGEGETWIGQITPNAADPDEIEDFNIEADVQTESPVTPAGIEITEASIDIQGEYSRYIIGTAESTDDKSIDLVRARGKVYNSDGEIIGTGTQHEYDGIPSDLDWNFELRLRDRAGTRADEANDVEVILDSRT